MGERRHDRRVEALSDEKVTGKLDVRDAAAALPETVDEPEAIEPSDDSEFDDAALDEEPAIEEAAA